MDEKFCVNKLSYVFFSSNEMYSISGFDIHLDWCSLMLLHITIYILITEKSPRPVVHSSKLGK